MDGDLDFFGDEEHCDFHIVVPVFVLTCVVPILCAGRDESNSKMNTFIVISAQDKSPPIRRANCIIRHRASFPLTQYNRRCWA